MTKEELAEIRARAERQARDRIFSTEDVYLLTTVDIPKLLAEVERLWVVEELKLRPLDSILADLYNHLITMSWESSDTFELYQNAWKVVEKGLQVEPFDWTKRERPHSLLEVK